MIIDKIATGERITRTIYEKGMTIVDFERKIGISHEGMWQITSGRVFPRCETLIKISVALGVSTDWILGLSDVRWI